jgi:hypothetical protein
MVARAPPAGHLSGRTFGAPPLLTISYRPASSRSKGSRLARESLRQGIGDKAGSAIVPRLGMLLEVSLYDVLRLARGYVLREARHSAEGGRTDPHGISNSHHEAHANAGL